MASPFEVSGERDSRDHPGRDGASRAQTWLKPAQVEQLRDECLADTCAAYLQDRNEAAITLAYDAGLRAGELCGLDVTHLDLDAGTLYLPTEIQKGSPPPVTIELDHDTVRTVQRYLRDRWKDTVALFPSRSSERLTTRSLQRLVKKLAVAAAVEPQQIDGDTGDPEDVSPHTLRHSAAYRIIHIQGGNLADVQRRLRHANRRTTEQLYGHLLPRERTSRVQ